MDLFPSTNRFYSLVIQEENNHKNVNTIDYSSILLNVAHITNFKSKGNGNNLNSKTSNNVYFMSSQ